MFVRAINQVMKGLSPNLSVTIRLAMKIRCRERRSCIMKRKRIIWAIALSMTALWSARAQTGQQDASSTGREGARPVFELVRVDKKLVDEFQKAWLLARNGTSSREAVVLVFRATDGRYAGRTLPITNEGLQLTFNWDPAAIAIVHTHPNHCDPAPAKADRQLSDRLRVPVITITRSGMFVYDPATQKTSKVQNGLDWLNSSNFFYQAPQP